MTSLELLNLTEEQKLTGVMIEGNKENGEYKRWNKDGTLDAHIKYENGKPNYLLGGFAEKMLGMIRRVVPQTLKGDLVGIQAMPVPESPIFTIERI